MIPLLLFILLLFILYGPFPTFLARVFHFRSIHTVPDKGAVLLTFDDGPDPEYTPQILTILRENDVRATFFLVAKRAALYPELVKQIAIEGHEVGSHGDKHHALWFKGWQDTKKELENSLQTLEKLTGQKPRWYRPPWGLLNLSALAFWKSRQQEVLLWSIMPVDWTRKATPNSIIQATKKQLSGGSIIVLHDNDQSLGAAEGAPRATIGALPELISSVKQQGYSFKTVSEVQVMKQSTSLWKLLLQSIWMSWEHVFEWGTRLRSVYVSNWGIFKIYVMKYHGQSIECEEGVWIHSGDWVGEIHLNNKQILEMIKSEGADRSALQIARMLKKSLQEMSASIEDIPELARVKAFIGITLLHRGIKGLGFELHPLKIFLVSKKLPQFIFGFY